MKLKVSAVLAASLLFASVTASHAQQVEWTQTLNLPKGLNLPQGVSADILGVAVGDGYDEARAKMEELLADSIQPSQIEEMTQVFYLQLPNGSRIEASYPGQLIIRRKTPGKDPRGVNDNLFVYFSAPSSAHQVIAMKRTLTYFGDADQPRISQLIAALKAKFKIEPQLVPLGGASRMYAFSSTTVQQQAPLRTSARSRARGSREATTRPRG